MCHFLGKFTCILMRSPQGKQVKSLPAFKHVFFSPRRSANPIHYSVQLEVYNCLGGKK